MEIQQQGTGRLFDKDIYLGEDDAGKVNLRLVKGSQMIYDKTPTEKIDFPGEYDIGGVTIVCIEADGKLSYIIKNDQETVAVLQNAAVLEVTTFDGIDTWICAEKSIQDEIETMELEGEVKILENIQP